MLIGFLIHHHRLLQNKNRINTKNCTVIGNNGNRINLCSKVGIFS